VSLPDPREQPLLRPDDLVQLLPGMGRSAVYEAIRRGELPSIRVGRRIYIPTARLLAEVFGIPPDMREAGPEAGPAIAANVPTEQQEVRRAHHSNSPGAA
jgi:helix-turn-helix protein